MKLIVGLGNPGRKYVGTRHNVGFDVVAKLARDFGISKAKAKFQGEVVEATINNERVILLCPCTFMNCSGSSVQPARDFYQLDNEDLLVVCDDLNLPIAKLRIRKKGSAGGQRGLQDIVRRLGTEDLTRLRIGIGSPAEGIDSADFVLSRFTKQEQPQIEQAVARAAEAAAAWAREGVDFCMNAYNAD